MSDCPLYFCPADRCYFSVQDDRIEGWRWKLSEHLRVAHRIAIDESAPGWSFDTRKVHVDAYRRWLSSRYPRMAAWTHETFVADEYAAEALEAVRRSEALNLFMYGDVGVGKTRLAWILMQAQIDEGMHGDFVNLAQLLADARRKLSAGEHVDPLARLLVDDPEWEGGTLVVDDVGCERPTEWALDLITTLVDHRYQQQLPTIYTSNYAPDALGRRLGGRDLVAGQRIVSRILDDCDVIHVRGHDRRVAA